ncbi:serine hydrolase [Kangiella profundi]|uniref:Serine hydrolase n=1 Tax=Kangiella profundi TaxID=1561924 RepID=A0A2K9AYK9_9GAMM|nr:serine hydrolase domain-containing protein [Kangiella profundi]AUD77748.1 serine hydrolase [Kangiella profundi]GGE92976.1 serine hydrolase [Kangiella profundi]
MNIMKLILLAISICFSITTNAKPNDQAINKSLLEWQQEVEQSNFSGNVLAILNGQLIYSKSFGLANREKKIPFNENTVFDIGSITKQFTATAIMKLVEEGKLSLGDTLDAHFENVPNDKKNITLHHLLTHTSGFTHGFGLYDVVEKYGLINEAFDSKLVAKPGDKYHYSNVGYSLLAIIIEKETNKSWEEYIDEKILQPAGLNKTGYKLVKRNESNLAVNYGRDPNAFQRLFGITAASESVGHSLQHQYNEPGPRWYMEGAGGFLSTIGDMSKWYLALGSEKILSQKSWKTIFTPYITENEDKTSYYGYGWAIGTNEAGHKRISHDGSNGYTLADFKFFPDKKVFIFMATNNRDDMPNELINKLELIILDEVVTKGS